MSLSVNKVPSTRHALSRTMAAKEEEYRCIFAFLTRHHYLLGFLYARWMCWKQYPLLCHFYILALCSVTSQYFDVMSSGHEWIFPELCSSPLSHPFLVPTTPVAYWWCFMWSCSGWVTPITTWGRGPCSCCKYYTGTVLWSGAVWVIAVSLAVLLVAIHSRDVLVSLIPLVTPLLSPPPAG